jgi:hypothetical protein
MSQRKKKRCEKSAINGSNVCRSHGAGSPKVKQAARIRLASLVDPAIDIAAKILKPKPGRRNFVKPELQWTVARDILDRNALKAKEEIVLTHEFDSSQFAHMSDEDIAQLVALARKAAVQKDARGQP